MRIFSGIKPSGDATFGNYSGGFRQYAHTQEQGDAYFCIVDLHAITVEHDPEELRTRTLDLASMLFATGLDPERSTVFVQSHVKAHAEAAWLLSAATSYGQLDRMTQFKEKGERRDFVSAALFNYPILMAGDILLYEADAVPIGDDQRQHLELARDIAERFNTRFGETFKVPEGIYPEIGARVMDLQDPATRWARPTRASRERCCSSTHPTSCARSSRPPSPTPGREVRARSRGKAGRLEPDRDHGRRHRQLDRRGRGPSSTVEGYGKFKEAVPKLSSSCSSRSSSATEGCAQTRTSSDGYWPSAPTRPARRARRRSRRCTSAWGSSVRSLGRTRLIVARRDPRR